MRLPTFEYLEPKNLQEALEILHVHEKSCSILAGGTDLLVRMKQRLLKPDCLMSLKSLNSLSYILKKDGVISIGACTSLAKVCASNIIQEHFPSLVTAVQSIGAPSIQHFRGTVGGNLCQDSRCLFYNQSAFWRSGKQPCHKAGGQICYAKEGSSDRCHATYQSDSAPVLTALGAEVILSSKKGARTIPLSDFYSTYGEQPFTKEPGELLTEIRIPVPEPGTGNAYKRLSYRSAIDYPIASAAAVVQISDDSEPVIKKARIVIGAISRAPLPVAQISGILEGKPVSDKDSLGKAADQAMDIASAFAVHNAGSALEYRVQMVSVLVQRAINEAVC